jgi:NAD-dependent DNA ligase
MKATRRNNLGKEEKNKKVKEGDCIFPFKYKRQEHTSCVETEKGAICATEINPSTRTLTKYGYCETSPTLLKGLEKRTVKKAPMASKKLKTKSPKTVKITTKKKTMSQARTLKRKLKIVPTLDVKAKQPKITETSMVSEHRYNEEFIDLLGKLRTIMIQQREPFRARAYQKAMESIMAYPEDIKSVEQIKKLPGIGSTIVSKLQEYVDTGKIAKLEKEKENPLNVLTLVYGVGPKKAKDLIDMGITSIAELRKRQDEVLNDVQKIGLEHYDDINSRIPRAEIVKYHDALKDTFDATTPEGSHFDIVGSYRRGLANSGDIDIIITNSNDDKKAFNDFLDALIRSKIVTHVLSRGAHKSLTIAKLPGMKHFRRVDFLYTSPKEYPFAVLYFTGSKVFNTLMRQRALDLGYTLNEHGLYKMVSGKKGSLVDHDFKNEESIFEFLGMKYKSPTERNDGRAIELLTSEKSVKETKPKSKARTLKKPVLKSDNTDNLIEKFKKKGIDALKAMSEDDLSKVLLAAQSGYHNQKPIMTDGQYDIIKEYVDEKYPGNEAAACVGAACAPGARNKVDLPFQMASMNKIKPDTQALPKWKQTYKGENGYVESAKLDGVSGMYVNIEGQTPRLYTRGNGKVGQDVSHILPYLNLPNTTNVVVRGEFVLPKHVFEEKYADDFSNARNLVAGIINALKKVSVQKYKDLDFVAYEVIQPELAPWDQMKFLESLGFNTVINRLVGADDLTNEQLSETLVEWRDQYKYEIDGVIITDNKIYPRESGNPEHSFAFKMVLSDQVAEAHVVNVIWSPSKHGYLKPRIQIQPVVLGGAKIEYATAFNAKFVEDNKLGIGAIVKLVRSGDVIPHIMEVITPAEKAQMPDMPYEWNPTHVDIMLKDAEADEVVREKMIVSFFKTLEVDGLGAGNVKRMVDAGFDSVPKILAMDKPDYLKVEGFKGKMATKIYDGIKNAVENTSLPELMAASNLFGRGLGKKRFTPILEKYPDILTSSVSDEEKKTLVSSVKGMGSTMVNSFVDNIPRFIQFMEESNLTHKLKYIPDAPQGDANDPLYGKEVVMTGFRDKELMKILEARGVKQGSSVKSDTVALLVKDLDEDTSKAAQAKKKGVPIMTVDMFKKKYDVI